jgi:hypothetical protein
VLYKTEHLKDDTFDHRAPQRKAPGTRPGLESHASMCSGIGGGGTSPAAGAYLTDMEELDATIGWLYEQTAHAQKALADLKSGHHNIEVRGRDKTQELIEAYEHLIAKCQDLISSYKDRRDR